MKKLALLIYTLLFCSVLNLNAQRQTSFFKDSLYSIQLGVYKDVSQINDSVRSKLTDLGFDFNFEVNIRPEALACYKNGKEGKCFIFVDTKSYINSNKDTVKYTIYRLQYEKRASLDSIQAILAQQVFQSYFPKAAIQKIYVSNKRFVFDDISTTTIIGKFNSYIEMGLFWDPLAAFNIRDNAIKLPNGEPVINSSGNEMSSNFPIVVLWLIIGAVTLTIYFGFINFTGFRHAIGLVSGKHDDPSQKGEVSHFQALATALSGTVGLGNIAGVAIAIAVGGPGATFWMVVAGLLGMSTKFVECTLGVKYRKINENGEVSGGPMYYLRDGLAKRGKSLLGKFLAGFFAVLCIMGSFGGGNMFQSNQAFSQFSERLQIDGSATNGVIFGIVLAILTGIVIIGGIKSIAKVTEKIVPLMAVLYVVVALVIVFMHIDKIGHVFSIIFDGAFGSHALKGGILGVLIMGFRRAAFSNEAGVGSASIAHSAVKTEKPITEGYVSLLEPFIDTVVICTLTALVIIITGFYPNYYNLEGAKLTSSAFESVFSWFPWLLMVAILLFAFSTMISWSYYGLKAWGYLFGENKKKQLLYKIIFLCFVVIGASAPMKDVVNFSDLAILGMSIPNLIGLYIMAPEIRQDLKNYKKELKAKRLGKG